jgi:predicted ATPase/DNA-binding winged helix-turn-helix (wHTH) protein
MQAHQPDNAWGAPSMPAPTVPNSIRFLDFEFFPHQWRLERQGVRVQLSSRALDILRVLISRPGEVVGKQELLERVWPHAVVDEGSIRFHMVALRRALGEGENDGGARLIVTVPGRGYCFVGATSEGADPPRMASPDSALRARPSAPGWIVGREGDVAGVLNRLRAQRCVSVVGAGGVGKSVVAAQAAIRWQQATDGAVTFVDLGDLDVDTSGAVAAAIAAALDGGPAGASPMAAILAHLARQRTLLVMDTCDAAIESAARVAGAILAAAPRTRLLTTGREALRIDGESIYRLKPLATPASDIGESLTEALDFPAVQLFIDRAASRSGANLHDRDAPVVASICRRLDGLPLAIEMAAAQAATFGVRGLQAQLSTALALDWPGTPSASPRHRTLKALLDWSYDRLPERERAALFRLSTLESPFSLETALAAGRDPMEMAQAISRLTAKSLLAAEEGATGDYAMLEVTRTYARTKLAARGRERGAARGVSDPDDDTPTPTEAPPIRRPGRCPAA